ncbi:MAG: hypothetical protein WED05_10095 [Candidatus Atabeyarchaeum deiterrae]
MARFLLPNLSLNDGVGDMDKAEILAVHRKRLEGLLRELGLFGKLRKGKLRCSVCGCKVSVVNIGFIIPSPSDILVCCTEAECIFEMERLTMGESIHGC